MKVFLSSTYTDLSSHRQRAAEAIERLGHQPVRMETFGARSLEATTASLEEVGASDAFDGIYAYRYGHLRTDDEKSISEQEFDFALQQKKPTFCFVVDENYPWVPGHIDREPGRSKLERFKQRVRERVVVDVFSSADDFGLKICVLFG